MCDNSFNDKILENIEFILIEGEGQTLVGRKTATQLGILQLGSNIIAIVSKVHGMTKEQIVKKLPECFTEFGKLKDFQLEIPIDESVKPVVQTLRRIPFDLGDQLESKLDELEKLDIIEKTTGPTLWVSPIVVVPKDNSDDIRICVDMRNANTAVKRERYPIPTIDEVLQDMNNSKVFSKLDIRLAFHQIELSLQSRDNYFCYSQRVV